MSEYQKYQLQWMIDHDISLDDLITELTNYQINGCEGTVSEIYDGWEHEEGFCGMLWACIDEWAECEGKTMLDVVYDQYVHDKNIPDEEDDCE